MSNALPTTMTAWMQDRYGGPDVVRRVTAPVPTPRPGEVLMRVGAASLNSADVRIMRGLPLLVRLAFGVRRPRTPIPGRDVAGVVVATGPVVTALRTEDRVAGEISGGALAEFVACPADRLTRVPAEVDDATAAALPLAGGTAWQALDLAEVAAGDRVLVLGAGGGVGTFAVRLAVLWGAVVHALCSPRAIPAVTGLGPDEVGSREIDLESLPPGEFDAVIDLGGRAPLRSLERLLRQGGSVVSVAGGENRVVGPLGRMLRGAILSLGRGRRIRTLTAAARPGITAQLFALAASGDLRPVIEATHALAGAGDALARVDAGGVVGKVIVTA